jgi:hypothetical protein
MEAYGSKAQEGSNQFNRAVTLLSSIPLEPLVRASVTGDYS